MSRHGQNAPEAYGVGSKVQVPPHRVPALVWLIPGAIDVRQQQVCISQRGIERNAALQG